MRNAFHRDETGPLDVPVGLTNSVRELRGFFGPNDQGGLRRDALRNFLESDLAESFHAPRPHVLDRFLAEMRNVLREVGRQRQEQKPGGRAICRCHEGAVRPERESCEHRVLRIVVGVRF